MVLIPPAEPPEINTFTTITRLTFLQTQDEQVSNTCTQPMYSDIALVNQNTNSSLKNQNVHPHNQSTVVLQQFSMITQELRNVMDKVFGDINKITQACTSAQENTDKLTENAILQAQLKHKILFPLIQPETLEHLKQTINQILLMTQTGLHPGKQTICIPQHPNNLACHLQRPYEVPVSPHAYVGQQPPNLTPFDFTRYSQIVPISI